MQLKRLYQYYTKASFNVTWRQHLPAGQSDEVANAMLESVWQEMRNKEEQRYDDKDGVEMVRLSTRVQLDSDSDDLEL